MPWYSNVQLNPEGFYDHIHIANELKDDNIPVFLVYQTDHAFAHWIYESFIYICHPSCLPKSVNDRWHKIHIHHKFPKIYMRTFLHSIGIPTQRQVSGRLPIPNYTYFLDVRQYLLTENIPIQDIWLDRFELWINQLLKKNLKRIHFVILPRQSRESYKTNDRQVHMEPMIDYVIERVKAKGMIVHTDLVLYQTDKSPGIPDQIQTVSRAEHLLLDMASSFFVNGMFAQNCKIIAIGPWRHHEKQAILGQVFQRILRKKNTIEFINPIKIEHGHEYHDATRLKQLYI